MKKEEIEVITNGIQEKVGKDNAGIIADDIGKIITDNVAMNNLVEEKDKEIEKLKKHNENLLTSNASLLQQISMGEDTSLNYLKEKENKKAEEKPKPFDFRTVFDEKGNFKN